MESLINSNAGLCSIEIGPEGIAFAFNPIATNTEIDSCVFYPYQFGEKINENSLKEQLSLIVASHRLKKVKCNWVLHPHHYRLTLINAPNVPQSEYKKAIRWQIKDIINYPLEDTSIDIFYPDEPEKSLKKIYVIATQNSFLQNIAQAIQDCGLYIEAIDIREFATRNLLVNLAQQNETIGSLSIVGESCVMVTIKQSNICFVRRFPINLQNLKHGNHSDLVIEIQRSFNYCQTELKQETPTRFFLPPDAGLSDDTIQNISKSLKTEIMTFNPQDIISCKNSIDSEATSRCWVVAGGALRNAITRKQ